MTTGGDFTAGVFKPNELDLVQRVFKRVVSEPWFPDDAKVQRDFGSYILTSYGRGLTDEEKLYEFCLTEARLRYENS